jgi:hypothetical protein
LEVVDFVKWDGFGDFLLFFGSSTPKIDRRKTILFLSPRDATMKLHVLLALAGLTIGFAVPILAQEKNAVDPQVRQQIEELNVKYDEAFNKNDAEGITTLFTVDAVEMRPEGPASGQPDIEERYGVLFQSHPTNHLSKLDQVYAIGNRVCAIIKWSVMPGRSRCCTGATNNTQSA